MTRWLTSLLGVALLGCAARGPARVSPADIARADLLVTSGCYRCLQDALTIYERQLAQTQRPLPPLLQTLFDTTLLTALRQKELGIDADETLARARALAPRLGATPGRVAPDVLVELADLAPAETSGWDPDRAAARITRERRERLDRLRPTIAQLAASNVTDTYLALSLECSNREGRERLAAGPLFSAAPPTILRYKLATCAGRAARDLPPLRNADPRWTDTAFFEGRAAVTPRGPDLRRAIDLQTLAHQAFPESSAIYVALAHAQRGYGDLEPALASYNGVLEMVPTHREALLGRVITLSYLERHAESADTATRMIDLGTWLMGDAYYWRARGRYILKMIEEAWSDAELAVKLAANTNSYTLAGVIAYDRKELDIARERFRLARAADATNCTAHAYFALVTASQNNWPEATPVFSLAMTCFVKAAADARHTIADIEAAGYDPVYRARLIADQEKTVKESELKAAQNAYNAAQGLLREGKRSEALAHLQLALEHPDMRSQAEVLQKLIPR